MDEQLPPIFERLKALGAPIFHYKTCSTFDSSPQIGSIGRAINIGQNIFRSPFVPLVVGAPVLGRHCVFGNLFARSGPDTEPYRLDRHPTMSRHPITPMNEADLCMHLSRQTVRKIGLLDILKLTNEPDRVSEYLDNLLASGKEIVLFDVLDDRQLPIIGRLIWQRATTRGPLLVAGSSGVEYALTAHWREAGQLPAPPIWTGAGPVVRIVVVSGSCSPVTDRQIQAALEGGFADVALDTPSLLGGDAVAEIERGVRLASDALTNGASPIVHTSRGPDDPRIACTVQRLKEPRASSRAAATAEILGDSLGRILQGILERAPVPRIAVAGGDTSSYVARHLGIEALEMIAPMAPGSPLCRVHAPGKRVDGSEIVFKGGQIGRPEFFGSVARGAP